MGNPVITRLGINQFWYKHWYADKSYHKTLKEDTLITHYLSFYLNYGAIFTSNLFLHDYWYRKLTHYFLKEKSKKTNLQAFQRYYYTNDRLGIEHSYLLRDRTGEYFPMRLWVMRYGGWLFLSVSWFKPLKTKSFLKIQKRKVKGAITQATAHSNSTKRIILVNHFLKSTTYKSLTYKF